MTTEPISVSAFRAIQAAVRGLYPKLTATGPNEQVTGEDLIAGLLPDFRVHEKQDSWVLRECGGFLWHAEERFLLMENSGSPAELNFRRALAVAFILRDELAAYLHPDDLPRSLKTLQTQSEHFAAALLLGRLSRTDALKAQPSGYEALAAHFCVPALVIERHVRALAQLAPTVRRATKKPRKTDRRAA